MNNARAAGPFDQRLARIAVRPLARMGVHPNHVTTAGLVSGVIAGWLLAQGGAAVHWGVALFMLAAFIDHMDGELARLTGKSSRFGAYYDDAAALTAFFALFVGAGLGLPEDSVLGSLAPLAGVVAGIAVAAIFGVVMRVDARVGRAASFTRQQYVSGFEIEDIMYLVGPVTWLGGLEYFLLASAVGAPLFLIFALLAAWRRKALV